MEAKKNEGNMLFQQKRFADAVQVYTSIINQLQTNCTDEIARQLEIAVRLNRAWAWLQMPNSDSSETTLKAAEQDCTLVIKADASCVKAYYRRALARERRGKRKLALDDAGIVKLLEPKNPLVGLLLDRLQQCYQDEDNSTLMSQQCEIPGVDKAKDVSYGLAEDAWFALQAAESNLQRTRNKTIKRSAMAPVRVKGAQNVRGEISPKTDELWEGLRREETSIIDRVFTQSKKGVLSGKV
ncbi:FOG: TPR repeat [Plasmopara halstedii]|uniref:FOG: TPR repeat n=1 Tax=Plasmopara halstedii TaxID=4781 RepID=A0A0P1AJE7_PLAHL|nr:FOG: TPR repeat [Plasmopara halstedii]CEG40933.1 FOG: TPR repeat [Plasmopara halstedii]|eukprot:XP_024577302.1 FOG: TPR repeat [Plasmopara halstedii]